MGYRIGIDVGGTFTDFVLVRGSGQTLELDEGPPPPLHGPERRA